MRKHQPPVFRSSAYSVSPLSVFLLKHMPEYLGDDGMFNTERLAKDLHITKQGLYRVLKSNVLTIHLAKAMIDVTGGRITRKDLEPFVWGDYAPKKIDQRPVTASGRRHGRPPLGCN